MKCPQCGALQHTQVIPNALSNYGPFMDWRMYVCPQLSDDEVGWDERRQALYVSVDRML